MHVDEYTLLEKDGVQFGVGSTKSGLGVVLYASKEKGDVSSFLTHTPLFIIVRRFRYVSFISHSLH